MFEKIFTAGKIGNMELKNRLIRSATYEALADVNGNVTDELVNFYGILSRGGIGLIILGYSYIQENGKCASNQTGIYNDSFKEGLKKIVDIVHKNDSKISSQIAHAGRQTMPYLINGQSPIAPSALPADPLYNSTPREMKEDEIYETIDAFGKAAKRSKEAGFDAVQIHAAHGYLVEQFLSPYTNKRLDKWGGNTEGRTNFLIEILKCVRKEVGNDYPVTIKLSVEEGVESGIDVVESAKIVKLIARYVDAIEISGGILVDTTFLMCRGDIPIDLFVSGKEQTAKDMVAEQLYLIHHKYEYKEAYWLEHAKKLRLLWEIYH